MSSRTAAARKRLREPLPKVSSVNPSAPNPRVDLFSASIPSLQDPHSTRTSPTHERTRLDLSNEFTSPEYSHNYPHPQSRNIGPNDSSRVHSIYCSNPSYPQLGEDKKLTRIGSAQAVPTHNSFPHSHPKLKRVGSGQAIQALSTDVPSTPNEDIHQSHHPLLPLDSHVIAYQTPPPLAIPNNQSLKLASPAKVPQLFYDTVPDLRSPPSYPPPSPTKYFSFRHSSSSLRSHALSDLPEYHSTCPSYKDNTMHHDQSWANNQHTAYQYPAAPTRKSSQSTALRAQLAALTISPINENRPPYPNIPGAQSAPNSALEFPRDSASFSDHLTPTSLSTSTGGWQPPAPPPSPNFVFPGSRSVARPKVSSKITNSQLKLKLRQGTQAAQERSLASDVSPNSQLTFEISTLESPVYQTPVRTNHPGTLVDDAFMLSDDYKRKMAPSVPKAPSNTFIYPTARSRAQPKISSRPKPSKNAGYSTGTGKRSRFMETIFKKKNKDKDKDKDKVKAPNISPVTNTLSLNSVATPSPEHSVSGTESNHEPTEHRKRTRRMKLRRGSYPLDPYNSVLLDNDRHTGELLSRLNPKGSPSFYDYGDAPPCSVLDLGCGQGHWVLEAAVAWKEYSTHITGYDMVDISRNLLPWAAEQGVRDNIRFVRGNFLKQQLPFASGTFDFVRMSCLALCIDSDSWGFVLQEVFRVLMPGGRLELIDDQMFFPYGKVSSLTNDDTSPPAGSVAPRLDLVLSPMITTFSIYGDVVANPGLGSTTVGQRGSDGDRSDPDEAIILHDHKRKVTKEEVSPVQPRFKPSIILSPEAWNRSLTISEDLEVLFEHMLHDSFDIHKDPSEFILSLMKRVFGRAQEMGTMNIVLAPSESGRSPMEHSNPQQQDLLSHCPGLILWPSTFIPMDHTEVEIHASKHLRTLLSCKNFLTQHAIEIAEDERVDEGFVSEALWEYESFLRQRFNPPTMPLAEDENEDEETNSDHGSIAESAMWEIQSEFRERFAWLPERDASSNGDTESNVPLSPPTPVSALSAGEVTHIRTFRIYEAIKSDDYTLTYDSY